MNEIISVIVPVFNTAPYLKRCVESVLNQSYQNFELILIDDGSTDGSGDICDSFVRQNNHIRVFHQENSGVCVARNKGIKEMNGDYFMFLDSDDTLDASTLELCYDRIIQDNSDVVIFGWQQIQNGQIIKVGVYGNGKIAGSIEVVKDILEDRHIYGGGYPNKMWRTSTFIEQGKSLPMFNPQLFYVEDMEWVTRMLLNINSISLINKIFYNYYLRDDSASRNIEAQEQRLIGYHNTMKEIVNDLQGESDIQFWFRGIYYTELINSTLDAILKRQKIVAKTLVKKLNYEKLDIMRHTKVSNKYKFRCIALVIAYAIRII